VDDSIFYWRQEDTSRFPGCVLLTPAPDCTGLMSPVEKVFDPNTFSSSPAWQRIPGRVGKHVRCLAQSSLRRGP